MKQSSIIKNKLLLSFGKDECCFSLDFYKKEDLIKVHFDINNCEIMYRYGVNFKGIESIFILCFFKHHKKEYSEKIINLLNTYEYIKIYK